MAVQVVEVAVPVALELQDKEIQAVLGLVADVVEAEEQVVQVLAVVQ
jgi:hypothetical protein